MRRTARCGDMRLPRGWSTGRSPAAGEARVLREHPGTALQFGAVPISGGRFINGLSVAVVVVDIRIYCKRSKALPALFAGCAAAERGCSGDSN